MLILLFISICITACRHKDLYALKTDLSDENGIGEIINALDWKDSKVAKFEIKNKNIIIYFDEEDREFNDLNLKPHVENGIYLLILTDAEEITYNNKEIAFFSMDKESADEIISIQYGKNLEDYKRDKKEFDILRGKLKKIKINT